MPEGNKRQRKSSQAILIHYQDIPVVDETEKPAAPSTKTKKEAAAVSSSGDPPKGNPKAKAKSEAESVLPTPSPKSHADKKNKKGRGKGRSSSPTGKKKIFCNYFFNKGGCLYSHSQKVYDARMKDKKGRSGKQRFVEREGEGNLFICWTKEEDMLAMAEGDWYVWE